MAAGAGSCRLESQSSSSSRTSARVRLVIEACLPFFCSSDPVPSVSERIDRDTKRLKVLVAHHGKSEEWKEWVWQQEGVILARHGDPTRGPSLQEFQRYKQQQERIRERDQQTIRQLRALLGQQNVQPRTAVCDDVKEDALSNALPAATEHKEEPTKHPQQSSPQNQDASQLPQQRQPTLLSAAEEEEIERLRGNEQQQQQQHQSSNNKEQKTKKKRKNTKAMPKLSDDDIYNMRTWQTQLLCNYQCPERKVAFTDFALDMRESYQAWYDWYHLPDTKHTARPYYDYKWWYEDLVDVFAAPDDVFDVWLKVAGISAADSKKQ
jgi:hypothetical protein